MTGGAVATTGRMRRAATRWLAVAGMIAGGALAGGAPAGAAPARPARPAVVATPVAAPGRGGLAGVSCTRPGNCWVTGYRVVGPPFGGIILRWNGVRLSYVPAPFPTGSKDSALGYVTCFARADCLAEGHYGNDFSEPYSYFDRWNGQRWSLTLAPKPVGITAGSTSCSGPALCRAVAVYVHGGLSDRIEVWNGARWTAGAPLGGGPGTKNLSLDAISCPSRTSCMAVGSVAGRTTGRQVVAIERWNGIRWSAMAAPTPGDAPGAQLNGVSCVSARSCVAVGTYSNAARRTGPGLIERWNGSTWTVVAAPTPGRIAGFQFTGVACRTTTSCQAWGEGTSRGGFDALVGGRWVGEAQTSPVGGLVTTGVSCAAATHCLAVGHTDTARPRLAAALWDGLRWTAVPVP